jgi:ADP-ribose pyrophosphatase YjhB (NUDIX family)
MSFILRIAHLLLKVRNFFTRPVTLGVRLLPIRGHTVLLVKHTYQDAWFIPGGGVHRGETLEQAVRREAAEECGAMINHLELFGVYTHFYDFKSDHIVVFLSTDFQVTGETDREIEQAVFFPFESLPGNLSSGSGRRIQEYKEGKIYCWGDW